MKRFQPEWLVCALLSLSVTAPAAEVHQHGLAEAAVVLDDELLSVSFRAPLMDILGTEQPPADAPARLRYDQRLAQVAAPLPSPAAQCELVSRSITSVDALFAEHGHQGSHHDHDAGDAHDEHARHKDVDNEWQFRCANTAKLKTVQLPFLETFSSLTTDVVLLLPGGQSAVRLAPGEKRISLE